MAGIAAIEKWLAARFGRSKWRDWFGGAFARHGANKKAGPAARFFNAIKRRALRDALALQRGLDFVEHGGVVDGGGHRP